MNSVIIAWPVRRRCAIISGDVSSSLIIGLASSGQDAAVGLAMLVERLHIEGFDSVRVTSVTSIRARLQLCCVSG